MPSLKPKFDVRIPHGGNEPRVSSLDYEYDHDYELRLRITSTNSLTADSSLFTVHCSLLTPISQLSLDPPAPLVVKGLLYLRL